MQAAKRVATNTGILYAKLGITIFMTLFSTRLILLALGAEDFGLFNVVGGAVAMLGFLNSSMTAATQRFMSYTQGAGKIEDIKQIFNISIILHFAIACLAVFVLEIAGYFLFDGFLNIPPDRVEAAKLVFQFMVLSTFFTIISVPYDAVLNARENMLFLAIIGIVEATLKLLIALYITQASGDNLITFGLLMAILPFFLFLIRGFYCFRNYQECEINFRLYFDKKLMKKMSSFAGWSLLFSSTEIISSHGQGIVINVFFGAIVNAAQGIAIQVRGQLSVFALTMIKALNPIIDKSEGKGDRNFMLNMSMMGSKISFFLMMLFFIPFIIEMPYILKLWVRDVPEFTIVFCQLLMVRSLIEQLFITLNSSISAVGEIKNFRIFASVLASLPLILSYIMYSYGYPAYTLHIIFLVYSIFASINTLFFANKICGLPVISFLKNVVLKCVCAFIIVVLISSIPIYVLPEGLYRIFIVAVISLITYMITVWYIGLLKEERIYFKDIVVETVKRFLYRNEKAEDETKMILK
ncbi:hypothetical protein H7F15_13840 [Pontibacter sp. Tf4]|uniref:MATE family efflux transporter n=1 Tax=Pontibacter sp. Tf4 TaxID=2761620 RepID=UPI00162903A6|nr:MATE family efflux transporter [Pontibacter sp. Tf4]MBB6612127.1 hypothetical protein [Pontibacter sp. Tf4]